MRPVKKFFTRFLFLISFSYAGETMLGAKLAASSLRSFSSNSGLVSSR